MDELDQPTEILMPSPPPVRQRMIEGYKLFHYTSIETAEKILRHKTFWLADTRHMNDVTEIYHGLKLVTDYLLKGSNARFLAGLEKLVPTLPTQIGLALKQVLPRIEDGVFASCVSEHSPSDDTNGGRLPMRPLYGDHTKGVAFVLEPTPFWSRSNALNAYSSPVLYGHKAEFEAYADSIGDRIATNIKYLKSIPLDQVLDAAIVPLRDIPDQGLIGMEPDALLVKIIVGPGNADPDTIPRLLHAMTAAGVTNAESRIARSTTPLRR
ncbi:MAG: hypothetical protein MO852_17270 [Candidatus Devosia euplotis]|nr:hypothetical protein [Candidatus Devosia euplotis]